LLDGWCQRHRGAAFDDGGRWAASGRTIEPLLAALLADPYFSLPPPKSTGRDLFNLAWLDGHLRRHARDAAAVDVQATLAALTIESIARDMRRHASAAVRLIVCGGGARNTHLMQGLAARLPGVAVTTSASHGLPVDQVEAVAFAWLAQRFCDRQPGNLAGVTGARGPRRVGALYPG
jgi:anhydro-N-acetylmuramic acid kinase